MRFDSTIKCVMASAWRAAGSALVLLGLASCGGGTEQIEPFKPVRLFSIGDELSVLTDAAPPGRKYSVNALAADGVTLDCAALPIWIQPLATTYGFAFAQCNPLNLPQTLAHTYAQPGAKAADFAAQAAQAEAAGAFSEKDLVTVLLGVNDVLELYRTTYVPTPTTATFNAVIAELKARGTRLGQQINQLTARGPKVILSTIPRLGLTPYGRNEATLRQDPQRPTVLNDFSIAFNNALRLAIVNDGRYIGLVELDALISVSVTNPGNYALSNVTDPACTVALPDCSTATLVSNATALGWLWADDIWLGTTAQQTLGIFARSRALGNPF